MRTGAVHVLWLLVIISRVGALVGALAGILVASVTVGLAGCKPSSEPRDEPLILPDKSREAPLPAAEAPWTIALSLKNLGNPFFLTMEQGARRAESELGIQLVVKSAADVTSVAQQSAMIEQLIRDKVDAIVVIPGHSTEMIPVVHKARAAGILVINVDNRLDTEVLRQRGLADIPFIGVDNEHGAYLSAKYLADKLTKPTQVAIIGGDPGSASARDRERGAQRAFAENEHVEVAAVENAYWKIDQARDVSARLFERYPKLGGIFCANDLMALGVIRYLEESKKEHVLVAAYDAIAQARTAVREGKLLVTVDQKPAEQGYLGIRYAMRALAGEKLPGETFIDVELVTAESSQQEEK